MEKLKNLNELKELLSNPNYYIHFDNMLYQDNEVISRNYFYGEDNDLIKKSYAENCGFEVNKLIYMLKEYKEEYEETYQFVYIVDATNVKKCQMDYSPMISYEDRPRSFYSEKGKENYYNLCALAYKNDEEAKKLLSVTYNKDVSNKEEYIAKEALVIKGYEI